MMSGQELGTATEWLSEGTVPNRPTGYCPRIEKERLCCSRPGLQPHHPHYHLLHVEEDKSKAEGDEAS